MTDAAPAVNAVPASPRAKAREGRRLAGGTAAAEARDEVDGPPSDLFLAYLLARLGLLQARVRAAIDRRRAADPDIDDRFRGLYISDAQVDALFDGAPSVGVSSELEEQRTGVLTALEQRAEHWEAEGARIRLREVAGAFGLASVDTDVLLVALAPDLDPRFERFYGYLHDDVSRRRASVGLALERRARGSARAPIQIDTAWTPRPRWSTEACCWSRTPTGRCSRARSGVPDRVAGHLLGNDAPDPSLRDLIVHPVDLPSPVAAVLARAITTGMPLAYVRERPGASGPSLAASGYAEAGRPFLALDLTRLGSERSAHDRRGRGARGHAARSRPGRRPGRGAAGPRTRRRARVHRGAGPGRAGRRATVRSGMVARGAIAAGRPGARGRGAPRALDPVPRRSGARRLRPRTGHPGIPARAGADRSRRPGREPVRRRGWAFHDRRRHRVRCPRPERRGPRAARASNRPCVRMGRPGPAARRGGSAPGDHGARPASRPRSGGVGDRPPFGSRPGHHRAVRRRLRAPARRCRPRCSPGRSGSTCTSSTCRRSSTSTSARPRRTSTGSSPRPTA